MQLVRHLDAGFPTKSLVCGILLVLLREYDALIELHLAEQGAGMVKGVSL